MVEDCYGWAWTILATALGAFIGTLLALSIRSVRNYFRDLNKW